MLQAITTADVHRGWIDCGTCGDTLRPFYHQRCPTCHTDFRVSTVQPTKQEETDTLSETPKCVKNYLLILSCSQRKRTTPETLAAMDRYDGPAYRTLRKAKHEGRAPEKLDVLIISARYGIFPCQKPIGDYDQRMTPKRATELRPRVQSQLDSFLVTSKGYDQVFINLGKVYMWTLEGFNWGRLSTLQATGGIGQKTSQMKAWLERIASATDKISDL